MVIQVKYKGEVIDINEVEVTWTNCFGSKYIGSIEDYASDYAAEQVGIAEAGEAW